MQRPFAMSIKKKACIKKIIKIDKLGMSDV